MAVLSPLPGDGLRHVGRDARLDPVPRPLLGAPTLEMVGAMFVPAIAPFPLLWAGLIAGNALIPLEHVAMLPLIYLVMLRRHDEYGGSSHG